MKRLLTTTAFTLVLGLPIGCGEQPVVSPPKPQVPAPTPVAPADPIEALLVSARSSTPTIAADIKLNAAALLIKRGDLQRAQQLLQELSNDALSSEQRIRRMVRLARIRAALDDPGGALALLNDPEVQTQVTELSPAVQIETALARADTLEMMQRHLDAARERMLIQVWITDESARHENARALLNVLLRSKLARLEEELAAAQNDDWRAWLELATVVKDLRRGPREQINQLMAWRDRNVVSPALETASLLLVPELIQRITVPARVAVLLPFSGRAAPSARAILDGFMAQHFAFIEQGETQPATEILDTTAAGGFASAYQRALDSGAQLVVGPLLKEELQLIEKNPSRRVPTLALNFSADVGGVAGLFQFGLDSNDEIRQLATAMPAGGSTTALILTDGSDWSTGLAKDFTREWTDHGGNILDTLSLQDLNEYRRQLEQTLLVEQSRERARQLAQLIGMAIESEPRRREDIELIVLFAEPTVARTIRPMLSFIYAGDLPIWGTGQLYSGRLNMEGDRDLEAVRFIDMPWFSGAESSLHGALQKSASSLGSLERLAALGADACRLQSRLPLLQEMPELRVSGATGELWADALGRVHRQLDWYVFANGAASLDQGRHGAADEIPMEGGTQWKTPRNPAPPSSDTMLKTAP